MGKSPDPRCGKVEFSIWLKLSHWRQMLEDADTIKLDENNTIMSLRDKLIALGRSGNDDGGFPILKKDLNEDGYRMVGYIGASELGHALSKSLFL